MTKIKMFEKMYELEAEKNHSKVVYGEKSEFAIRARIEWYGGREVLEAAGLYDEYFNWKMSK